MFTAGYIPLFDSLRNMGGMRSLTTKYWGSDSDGSAPSGLEFVDAGTLVSITFVVARP